MECTRERALFVGVDVHKETHTAVGLSPVGEKVFEMTISNQPSDFVVLAERISREASARSLSPYVGLEDCRGLGERLSTFFTEAGYPLVHVPPVLVDNLRKHATHPEKNDSLDARGVAEVMIRRIDTLPAYTLTEDQERASRLKELSHERGYLVREQTRWKNQLHGMLHRIWNGKQKKLFKDPFSKKALTYWSRSRPVCDDILQRRMKRAVRRLQALKEEVAEIERDLRTLLQEGGYTLQTASGCGVVTASNIIGEIGDISSFRSPASLAKYAGCSPREHSSGKSKRHTKTRGGNRRLNCAFHRMALTQISRMGNDAARSYFRRKISEGKSKQQALVCLRRQLVTIVWCMMKHKTEYRYPQ